MYGAILGDMIGAPYEFDRGNKTKDFELFGSEQQFRWGRQRYTDMHCGEHCGGILRHTGSDDYGMQETAATGYD